LTKPAQSGYITVYNARGSFGEAVLGQSFGVGPCFFLLLPVKTKVYVDGFNLYFGALKGTSYKWLNIVEAVRNHIKSHHVIVGTKYFTAKLNPRPHDPHQPLRQATYLRALRTTDALSVP
jgi:hypothetical protein